MTMLFKPCAGRYIVLGKQSSGHYEPWTPVTFGELHEAEKYIEGMRPEREPFIALAVSSSRWVRLLGSPLLAGAFMAVAILTAGIMGYLLGARLQ